MTFSHANYTGAGYVGVISADAEGSRPLYESATVCPSPELAEYTAREEWRQVWWLPVLTLEELTEAA